MPSAVREALPTSIQLCSLVTASLPVASTASVLDLKITESSAYYNSGGVQVWCIQQIWECLRVTPSLTMILFETNLGRLLRSTHSSNVNI